MSSLWPLLWLGNVILSGGVASAALCGMKKRLDDVRHQLECERTGGRAQYHDIAAYRIAQQAELDAAKADLKAAKLEAEQWKGAYESACEHLEACQQEAAAHGSHHEGKREIELREAPPPAVSSLSGPLRRSTVGRGRYIEVAELRDIAAARLDHAERDAILLAITRARQRTEEDILGGSETYTSAMEDARMRRPVPPIRAEAYVTMPDGSSARVDGLRDWLCPDCREKIPWGDPYCRHCGRALHWTEH